MAQMHPEALAGEEFHSRAEHKLHDALRDQLPDDWDVYHSASWLLRSGSRGAWEGEIDFVAAHPDAGVLCIEAKGGAVALRDGRWHRREEGEWIPYRRDPFQQATDEMHALKRLVRRQPGWSDGRLLIGRAVSFPELSVERDDLPPQAPREIIIDRRDCEQVECAVRRALGFFRDSQEPPGERGMRMLHECLVPELEIEVPLAETFLEEEEQLIRLTREQTDLLRRHGRDRRMCIQGCAGSGKTMLAVEQAKWLKRARDAEVAFVCFNRQLADHLKERERASGIHFYTFHGLCTRLAGLAGLKLPKHAGDPPPEYWMDELPEAMADAAAQLEGAYDAIMVDEAQDLHSHWLTALMSTLRDEAEAWVWLFMDSNQRVYHSELKVPPEFHLFDLTVNCRNTQAIHREVMKKYRGEVVPEARGPEGRPPELIQTGDQPGAVAGVIARLCGQEEVPPQDLVVLSSHGFANSEVAQSRPGKYGFTQERGKLGDFVHLSSIRGFKGLEAKVVILCELEDIEDETLDAQIYVGMSRALNHCVLVVPG